METYVRNSTTDGLGAEVLRKGFQRGVLVHGVPISVDPLFLGPRLIDALEQPGFRGFVHSDLGPVVYQGRLDRFIERFVTETGRMIDAQQVPGAGPLKAAIDELEVRLALDRRSVLGLAAIYVYSRLDRPMPNKTR